MDTKQEITRRYFREGDSERKIARDLKISRKTVKKYLQDHLKAQEKSEQDGNTDVLQDANETLIRFLEGLRGNGSGFKTIARNLEGLGLEGARVTGVLAVLAGNTGLLRQQQEYANSEFRRGVSLTNEFNIKNQTAQANLEKAIKHFKAMAVELGEKLVPVVQGMVHTLQWQIERQNAVIVELAHIEKYRYEIRNDFEKIKARDSRVVNDLDNKLDVLPVTSGDSVRVPNVKRKCFLEKKWYFGSDVFI